MSLGDLKVAPYNTFYPQLKEHLSQVGIEASVNLWDEPLALGVIDLHDALSHPAGVSDVQAETATCLDPDQFTKFLISNWFAGESPGCITENPFTVPEVYVASQLKNLCDVNICDFQPMVGSSLNYMSN
ncbi:hypothetical protein Ancab_037880 [Ancistrocladus abbreviatus]